MEATAQQPAAKYDSQDNYLVFAVNKQLLALPHHRIISVLDNPGATLMPGMSPHARGVMEFMGEPVTYFDFRKIIGVQSVRQEIDELHAMLLLRRQDHLNWINTLKGSVNQGTAITVQTNPHLCAFGKWYDSFHSENLALGRFLQEFDLPHRQIHAIGLHAQEFLANGNREAALALIHETENRELAQLLRLFDRARGELERANSQYAIVTHAGDRQKVAFAVDEPKYFGLLEDITYPLPRMVTQGGNNFVDACGFLRADGANDEVLIVDLERLIYSGGVGGSPAPGG